MLLKCVFEKKNTFQSLIKANMRLTPAAKSSGYVPQLQSFSAKIHINVLSKWKQNHYISKHLEFSSRINTWQAV